MSDKKNIDRLFQEKFKDFEVEPNEQIWINIDAALRENKKRRVIPIWFKLTGIAAGLILGFFAFNFMFDDSTLVEENQVVIGNEKPSNDLNSIGTQENQSVANTENSTESNPINTKENKVSSSINQKTNGNNSASENNNTIVNQKSTKTNTLNSRISSEKNNPVATTSTEAEKPSSKKKATSRLNPAQNQNNAVTANQSAKNKNAAVNTNPKTINPVLKTENNAIVIGENNSETNNIHKENLLNQPEQKASIAGNQKTADEQNNSKKDNFLAVDVPEKTTAKKDSTSIAVAEPNALEELLKKNEEGKNTVAEAKMNRWQITSNVAPIYFSSTSNGSPIDAQFAENSKSYENNLSFGVGVNYAVSKKISVRTGVNKFTLGYNTNDVVFFAAMDKVSFGSVASSDAGSTIQVVSQNNSEALRPFDNDVQNTNEGVMTQRMGYFEFPVEMSYKLIDQKFGVNLIGGMSTLFLNENEVSVSSSTMSASLGRAKNLNDVHFSTNVGIGFKYRFWKSFEANFEPMFKYQINTFNKDAGNFKPYFIGLYSGVSFNF